MAAPITQAQRDDILRRHSYLNQRPRAIARAVRCTVRTVQRVVSDFRQGGERKQEDGRGRPPVMDDEMMGTLDRLVARHPRATSETLAANLARASGRRVSARTVRRSRAALGYHPRRQTTRHEHTQRQKQLRVNFSRAHRRTNVRSWLFADETSFVLSEDGDVVWVKHGEPAPHRLVGNLRCKVNVWAAVWHSGRSTLHFTKKSINSEKYTDLLQGHLLPTMPNGGRHTLLHDNARFHTSTHTKDWLDQNNLPYIDDFPPYSPDMNAIEHVFGWMHNYVRHEHATDYQSLKQANRNAWANLPQATIQGWIDGVPHVFSQIIAHEGNWID
jgi:transposase